MQNARQCGFAQIPAGDNFIKLFSQAQSSESRYKQESN